MDYIHREDSLSTSRNSEFQSIYLSSIMKIWYSKYMSYAFVLLIIHLTVSMIYFIAVRLFSLKDRSKPRSMYIYLTDSPSVFRISVQEAHSHRGLSPQKSSQMKQLTSFVLILSCTTLCIPFTSALWWCAPV